MAVCEPDLQTPVMGVTEAWLRLDFPIGTRRPAEWLGDPSNITQITASSVTPRQQLGSANGAAN